MAKIDPKEKEEQLRMACISLVVNFLRNSVTYSPGENLKVNDLIAEAEKIYRWVINCVM